MKTESDKLKLKDSLQNIQPELLKTVKVIKSRTVYDNTMDQKKLKGGDN